MNNNTKNLINEIINTGKKNGIGQLITEDVFYDGRNITVNGNRLLNFGSCSYLGLELDSRLKEGAIKAIQDYGVQFSSSRTYLSCTLYKEYESLITKIFDAPIVLSTSVSLGHHAVMPIIIEDGDAIILDQQVHASVQDAVTKMKGMGIYTTIIRHNNLDELKNKVEELSQSHNRVWYMIDGVYSMYGDFAPIHELTDLLNKYKKLHIYADDAHGLGWTGPHGGGYILSQVKLHQKMIIASSLNKAFAAGGGVFIIPDKILHEKVRNCGGAFIFSGPHQIAVLGAGIAAAKIFLSEEIYEIQRALAEKIKYCHELLVSYNLPVVSDPSTPIFFIALGLVRVGYNMVERMIREGLYVNMSVFPAVPECCTGMRFTITMNHTLDDIEKLVTTIAYHFPKALIEEGRTFADISRAFRKVAIFPEFKIIENKHLKLPEYYIQYEQTIDKIEAVLWNSLFPDNGIINHQNLKILENSFSHNQEAENNWTFHYIIIRDQLNKPILATFLTCALCKDDALSQAHVSKLIEQKRKKDPYFLTSKTLIMGSLITEGDHLFLDRNNLNWKNALMSLLDEIWKIQDFEKASILHLRDFKREDNELHIFFKDQGFIPVSLPESNVVINKPWKSEENYLEQLKSDRKNYVKKRVFAYEKEFNIEIIKNPSLIKLKKYYSLYKNVAEKSFHLNGFILPFKLFNNLGKNSEWEFIEISLKDHTSLPIGVAINHQNGDNYNFILTGMNYDYVEKVNLYPNILWQIIKRANYLKAKNTSLGFTASQNKRKFNAVTIQNVGYIQMKDNYSMSILQNISNGETAA